MQTDISILIVEDSQEFGKILQYLLTDLGYQSTHVTSGPEALSKLRAGLKPSLILSDIRMPGGSGLELSMSVAKEFTGTPVLLMSGQVEIPEQHLKALNAKNQIQKPFTAQELDAKIKACLSPTT